MGYISVGRTGVEVHGDPQKRPAPLFAARQAWASPTTAIDALQKQTRVDSIVSIHTAEVLGSPVYQIHFISREANAGTSKRVRLFDARTGTLRPPLQRRANRGGGGNCQLKPMATTSTANSRSRPTP